MAPDLLSRLRSRGWRLSPQRRVVAEVLAGDNVHLTAEEVHDLARARLPEISRATVYNTLNELVAMGEILPIELLAGPKRYDPNVSAEHDHFVCDTCGSIFDLPRAEEPHFSRRALRADFVISRIEVTYRGVCPACAGVPAATGRLPAR